MRDFYLRWRIRLLPGGQNSWKLTTWFFLDTLKIPVASCFQTKKFLSVSWHVIWSFNAGNLWDKAVVGLLFKELIL